MGDEERERNPIGPVVPMPEEHEGDLARKCEQELESMAPKQTADCAGAAMTELYENEEDGGS